MSGISQTEAAAYKAKSIARGKLLERFRDAVHNICDGAVNEVDRVYFGSTNDFEYLKECALEMEDWNWDRIMREREEVDPYAVMKDQRAKVSALEEENKRLREELEKANNEFGSQTSEWPYLWRRIADLKEYQRKAELRAHRLGKALEPFAREAERFDGVDPSSALPQQCWFTVSKFLDARAALETKS